MSSTRIAIFASAYHPHLGGVEEVVHQLAMCGRRAGRDVIVLTNRWPRELPAYEVHEGVPIHRLPFRFPIDSLKSKLTYAATHSVVDRKVATILRNHGSQLVHVHCISTNGVYAQRAARRLGLPLVATAHGELTMDAGQIFQTDHRAAAWLRDIAASADRFTGCSAKTLADVEAFVGRPFGERGGVILNGTDTELFSTTPPADRRRPYVFTLGRLVPQKGFDLLLRAFAEVRDRVDVDAVVAGDGPEHDTLAKLATELGIADRVELVGRTTRPQTAALMAGARAVVMPSRADEGLPLVSLEALASGRPLLATRSGGIEEVVTDGLDAVLVTRGDITELAGALVRLCRDDALADRIGRAGRERASTLGWAAVEQRYADLYDSVLAAR